MKPVSLKSIVLAGCIWAMSMMLAAALFGTMKLAPC